MSCSGGGGGEIVQKGTSGCKPLQQIIARFKLELFRAEGSMSDLIFPAGLGGEVQLVIYSHGFLQRICGGDFPEYFWWKPRCSGDLQLIFEDGDVELQVVMVPPWCCAIFGPN
jgi:hypothetical protein